MSALFTFSVVWHCSLGEQAFMLASSYMLAIPEQFRALNLFKLHNMPLKDIPLLLS